MFGAKIILKVRMAVRCNCPHESGVLQYELSQPGATDSHLQVLAAVGSQATRLPDWRLPTCSGPAVGARAMLKLAEGSALLIDESTMPIRVNGGDLGLGRQRSAHRCFGCDEGTR
jgi:hypothetical protein